MRSVSLAQTGRETGASVLNESRGKHSNVPCQLHTALRQPSSSSAYTDPCYWAGSSCQLCLRTSLPTHPATAQLSKAVLQSSGGTPSQGSAVISPILPLSSTALTIAYRPCGDMLTRCTQGKEETLTVPTASHRLLKDRETTSNIKHSQRRPRR